MATLTNAPTRFVGCDVGKRKIVVAEGADGQAREIDNCLEALAAPAAELDASCLVVWEATGGYEAVLLGAMLQAGIAVHRADARKSLPPRRRG